MKYKVEYIVLKIQEKIMQLTRSKLFLYGIFVLFLGLVVVAFTAKSKKSVIEDFYINDILESRVAEEIFIEDTKVSMSEINRISKLLTFFFNDIIVNKTYKLDKISEYYTDINRYDMQIIDVSKAGTLYEVTVIIAVESKDSDELIYIPYKEYEIIINSTNAGLKVETISILE